MHHLAATWRPAGRRAPRSSTARCATRSPSTTSWGCGGWVRAIVYPSVLDAFAASMTEQLDARTPRRRARRGPGSGPPSATAASPGDLRNYFTWAPTVDRFTPPGWRRSPAAASPTTRPVCEVLTPDRREVGARPHPGAGQDQEDVPVPWLLYHRFTDGPWADLCSSSSTSQRSSTAGPGARLPRPRTIAGTIHDEVRRRRRPAEVAQPPARHMSLRPARRRRAPGRRGSAPRPGSGRRLVQEETPVPAPTASCAPATRSPRREAGPTSRWRR